MQKPIGSTKSGIGLQLVIPLAYLLLALLYTYPLVLHLTESIPASYPDSNQNIWNFWWVRTSLFERFKNPYVTDVLFYPYRNAANPLQLYYHTLQPTLSIPGGILASFLGNAAAFNLIILTGYVATGWAAYALARYFMGYTSYIAPFLAGAFYNFGAYHQHSVGRGQINVHWQQWIPLYLLFLHKALSKSSTKNTYLYPILAILCLWLTFYSDWYYFAYLGVYSVALYLFMIWRSFRKSKEGYNWRELRAYPLGAF